MQISDLNRQYNNTTSSPEAMNGTRGVEKLVSSVRDLTAGNIFEGTVNSVKNGQVVLGLSNGTELKARLDASMQLVKGQSMFFQVKSNTGGTIAIRPYTVDGAGVNLTLLNALKAAALPVSERYLNMANTMMQEQMPIDKNSMAQMARILMANPDMSVNTLVQMKKLNIPITTEMVAQFENYMDDSSAVHKALDSFISELPSTMAGKDMPLEQLKAFDSQLLQILAEGMEDGMQNVNGAADTAQSGNPAGAEAAQAANPNAAEASAQATSANGADNTAQAANPNAAEASAQATSANAADNTAQAANPNAAEASAQVTNPDAADGTAQVANANGADSTAQTANANTADASAQAANSAQNSNPTDAPAQTTAAQGANGAENAQKGEVVSTAAEEAAAQTVKETANEVAAGTKTASPSQEQVLRLLHGLFGDTGITSEDSPASLLHKLSQLIKNGENVSKDALNQLFSSKDMRQFLRDVMEGQMYLAPEDVADADKVKKLYDRLESKTQNLQNLLNSVGLNETPLAQTIADVHGNVDFMNQLNQNFTYVQIPLKMSGQNASGQLYVYTKKRDLGDPDRDLTAFLHLDLDHLGSTDVSVRLHHREVDTKFYMDSDEAYALVKQHMPELEKRLRLKGYNCRLYVENEGKKVNFVEDFLKKDAPATGQLHRYSFDVRA